MTPFWCRLKLICSPILEELASRGARCRFHTPNALHARYLNRDVARWLKRANFATLRLGVETAAPGKARLDEKLQEEELRGSPELSPGSRLPPEGHRRLPPHRPAGTSRRGGSRLHTPGPGPRLHPGPGALLPHPRHQALARGPGRLPLRPGTRTPLPQQLAVSLLAHLLLGALHPPETPGPGFVVVVCSWGGGSGDLRSSPPRSFHSLLPWELLQQGEGPVLRPGGLPRVLPPGIWPREGPLRWRPVR